MVFSKKSLALGLAGILTVAATTPSFAQRWEPWAAGAAGAADGSAAARGYGPGGYAYGPGYAPGYGAYAYQPGGPYAYQPGGVPAYGNYHGTTGEFGHYDSGFKDCATDGQYNRTDYSAC